MRAFVAVSRDVDKVVELIESKEIEVIPLTSDSIVDNLESFNTCSLILIDSNTPHWVLREISEQKKFSMSYLSVPTAPVVCHADSIEDLSSIIDESRDMWEHQVIPVTPDYVRKLGQLKINYPARRSNE